MIKAEAAVASKDGIHARPAAEIARMTVVSKIKARVSRADGKSARADSILELMTLGLKQGEKVTIEVDSDSVEAEDLLRSLIGIVDGSRLG